MAEIIKVYRQELPALRLIGKRYPEPSASDWGEWFEKGWFAAIEKQLPCTMGEICEDGDAYLDVVEQRAGEPAVYWIGMFTPPETPVPEGFDFADLPASAVGVCWVYGSEETGEIHSAGEQCRRALEEAGLRPRPDSNGVQWSFKRYCCPRFTTSDDKGNVILDACFNL